MKHTNNLMVLALYETMNRVFKAIWSIKDWPYAFWLLIKCMQPLAIVYVLPVLYGDKPDKQPEEFKKNVRRVIFAGLCLPLYILITGDRGRK